MTCLVGLAPEIEITEPKVGCWDCRDDGEVLMELIWRMDELLLGKPVVLGTEVDDGVEEEEVGS